MFSEREHACLLVMARDCRARGLTEAQAARWIETDLCGISYGFRIRQAVATAFAADPPPDLVCDRPDANGDVTHSAAIF